MSRTRGTMRVIESHRIARTALLLALVFAVVAATWSLFILSNGGSWWGPLHALLAGSALLAISGTSQMFTITWSSTSPPSRTLVDLQRRGLFIATAAVLVGMTTDRDWLVWFGGASMVVAVALLGHLIVASVGRSLLRRFDLSSRFYLTGFAAGAVGITLGSMMGTGLAASTTPAVRLVHAHLNLLGLVGLTIIGTIPTLLPTTAYHRAVSGFEARLAWVLALIGTAAIGGGLWNTRLVGIGTLLIAGAGILILGGIWLRLWRRIVRKLAPLQITIGTLWLLGWATVDGVSLAAGGAMAHFGGWTAAAALAGVGQVMAGSVSYLVPVLKGSPFPANRRIMGQRPWLPLLTLNLGGIAVGVAPGRGPAILIALWFGDLMLRLARVVLARSNGDDG